MPYAVIITTGIGASTRLTACRNSSPLIPGNRKSVTTRSKLLLVQHLQARLGVRRALHLKTFVGELQLDEPPQLGFVFHDEYRSFFRVISGFALGSPPKLAPAIHLITRCAGAQARTRRLNAALCRVGIGDIRLDAEESSCQLETCSRGEIDDATVEADRQRKRLHRLLEQGYPENLRRGQTADEDFIVLEKPEFALIAAIDEVAQSFCSCGSIATAPTAATGRCPGDLSMQAKHPAPRRSANFGKKPATPRSAFPTSARCIRFPHSSNDGAHRALRRASRKILTPSSTRKSNAARVVPLDAAIQKILSGEIHEMQAVAAILLVNEFLRQRDGAAEAPSR